MTNRKLVNIHVLGITDRDGEREEIETVSDGLMETETETGRVHLFYKEISENEGEELNVSVLFVFDPSGNAREGRILRSGIVKSEMLFIGDSETECIYRTPLGELGFEILTTSIDVSLNENGLKARLTYKLSSGGQLLSDAEVRIEANG